MPQTFNLFHIAYQELFEKIKSECNGFQYDFVKHSIELKNNQNDILGIIRLPLHLQVDQSLKILSEEASIMYLSIESGYAALCVMKGKQNLYHTTFGAYMTRKKQGFSQIKYLNKKGKSRAGSRVRLAATLEFFEKINTSLTDIFKDYIVERIALDCNATLKPYFFQSKIPPPFDKKDERLYKIPLHIPQSNFSNLNSAIKKLMAPVLFYNEESSELIKIFDD